MNATEAYHLAQKGIADLKAAILALITSAGNEGLTNAEVGKALGIYRGHSQSGHEGHVSRFLLERMREEQVIVQGDGKRWRLASHPPQADDN